MRGSGPAEVALLAAAIAVVAAAAFGGAFFGPERVVVGIGLVATLVAIGLTWEGRLEAEEGAALAVIGAGVAAAALYPQSPLAAKETLAVWLVAICLWLAARRLARQRAQTVLVLLVAGAALLPLSIVGEAIAAGGVRVGGVFENPNLAAALLAPIIPLTGAVGARRPRGAVIALAMWLALGVVLTGSRAGLLAVAIALAAALPRSRTRVAVVLAAGAVAAAAIAWRLISQPDVLAWFRPAIWRAVLGIVAQHPLTGVGPGGLADAAGPVRIAHHGLIGRHPLAIAYAESTPLAVLVELGLVGTVVALVALALWLRARGKVALGDRRLRSALAAMVVVALVHDLLRSDVVLWWWALLIGALEATAGEERRSGGRPSQTVRAVLALVLGWALLWGLLGPAAARQVWRRSQPTLEAVERTMRLEPWLDAPARWRAGERLATPTLDWERAAEALYWSRRAVAAHPGSYGTALLLGRVEARMAEELGAFPELVREARHAFDRAAELEPHLPWPWLERARLERALGRPEAARRFAVRALEEEPSTVRAWLFLSRVELDAGRLDAARRAFARARQALEAASGRRRSAYERDLLLAPGWQLRELEEALR